MKRRRIPIPRMRKPNSREVRPTQKTPLSVLDTWGCNVEPGKYFGRFPHREQYFYVYGSWTGDSVSLHREESRDGDPVALVYFTPSKAWWTKPLVYGTEANGLKGLHDSFTAYAGAHPELTNL